MNDKTPLNFIKEKGLLEKYYAWGGKRPVDLKKYHRERYQKKKLEALQKSIDAKRNPQ